MRKQPKNTLHFHIKCPQKWEGRGGSRFPDMTASFLSIWFDIITLPFSILSKKSRFSKEHLLCVENHAVVLCLVESDWIGISLQI